MQNVMDDLLKLLKKDERLVSQDGVLLKNQTQELARKNDPELIRLLLSDKAIKQHFFFEIEKALIFDKEKFVRFVSNKQFLPDSYTAFKNKIGLTSGDEYLSEGKEVVLAWPYKDCVLEGGMTKEDQKRDEIFYNETLAPDDINRLLDPKVFINFKRIDKKGEHKLDGFKRNKKGVIEDNLIIKGNNLLVLSSLKKEFAGEVKLIYIDPPYNTGGDANIFTYNNTFNHSSWLTFIRNRLKIARELLREDGFIAIAIDHFELGYLLVLSDEIFGRENRLGIISIVNNPMGRNQAKYFSTINDYMLVYAKDQSKANFNNVILNAEFYKTFNEEDSKGKYKLNNFIRIGGGDANLRINKESFWYPIYVKADLSSISLEEKSGHVKIFPITAGKQERTWKLSKKSTENILDDLVAKKENGRVIIYEKYRIEKGQKVPTVWAEKKYNANHQGIRLLKNVLGNNNFSYPKSLYTVLDALKIMTSGDDIILDFFAGSGTAGHATLELNKEDGSKRQFILVEQLDEHFKICCERIKRVIAKNNTEDSFVEFELAKWNEEWIGKIKKAKTRKELIRIYEEMEEVAFLSYKVDPKTINVKEKDFADGSVDDQKMFLIECLDKNHLYVNLSEIEDREYGIKKDDRELNSDFYLKRK
ncbi:MAG: site-specific DNA-methyltransferase [Candidatus Omnitrophota bacterium]